MWRRGHRAQLQPQGCDPSWDHTGHRGVNLQALISPYTLAHAWGRGRGRGRTSAPKERPIQESRRRGGRKSPGRQPSLGQARDARPGQSEPGTVRLGPSSSNAGDLVGVAGGPRPQTPPSASRTPSPAAAPPVVSAPGPRFRPFPHTSRGALAPSGLVVLRPAPPRPAPLSSPAARPALPLPATSPFLGRPRPTLGFAPPRALAVPGQAPLFPFGRPRPAPAPRPAPSPFQGRPRPTPSAGPAPRPRSPGQAPPPVSAGGGSGGGARARSSRTPHSWELGECGPGQAGRRAAGRGRRNEQGYRSGLAGGGPAIPRPGPRRGERPRAPLEGVSGAAVGQLRGGWDLRPVRGRQAA